ncbi:MAG: bifunctional adenosylcobinamide kinase/adenosylcobinamide-phosphate guanylyltransferase [Actinobacteria bacterium]|nr:bifunctional adenosylcobinamide kinase/adenosylcobinamide-phosphate guanylyltransferase [Actinomycetota bacterium]
MSLTVILGGARSGKSGMAQRLARATGRPVVFLATATAGDDEMAARIERHRRERPTDWVVIEEPVDLSGTLERIDGEDTVIIDCVTLWLSNVLGIGWSEPTILAGAAETAQRAGTRPGETIVVSNEVGMGVVPVTPLGRSFRDLAGRVNRTWVDAADRAGLVVAGRVLPLLMPLKWDE